MASVRITDSIRKHVKQRFNDMQRKRINAQHETIDVELCEKAIRTEMHHEAAALAVQKLDDESPNNFQWINRRNEFRVRSTNGSITVKLNNFVYVPLMHASSYTPPTIVVEQAAHPELFAHLEKIFARCVAIQQEYDNLRDTLCNGVLNRCTTLRQVLELWPSAIDFMPSEVVDKHRQKPPKRDKKQDVTEQIKIEDSIKAALAKERMINGSQ